MEREGLKEGLTSSAKKSDFNRMCQVQANINRPEMRGEGERGKERERERE